MKKDIIGNKWDELLSGEWQKPYYRELRSFLIEEYETETVYPPAKDIYNALRYTDYDDVKVVILGQDPYHEPGQAHGLAFSVPRGTALPPSLANILKELESDTGIRYMPGEIAEENSETAESIQSSSGIIGDNTSSPAGSTAGGESTAPGGILDPWAKQGVLLLNTVLTVRAHRAASHNGRGWEQFTDRVIELLAERERPMAFVLWGAHAQKKKELILRAQLKSPALSASQMHADADRASDQASLGGSHQSDAGLRNYGRASDQASLGGSHQSDAGLGIDNQMPPQRPSRAGARHLIIEAPHPSPLSAYRGFFGGCYFSRCNYFLQDNGVEPVDWSL